MEHNIHQTVGVLIDGNNIELGIKSTFGAGNMLDYLSAIDKVLKGRYLSSLDYFREGKVISIPFKDMLKKHFFGSVHPCGKSADIAIAIKAVLLSQRSINTIIIFSGDIDFCPLVEYLKSVGVRVEVVYVAGTQSKNLLEVADDSYCILKEDLRLLKSYHDKKDERATTV
jgi:uncharacterized LabA/DUF88 family protein